MDDAKTLSYYPDAVVAEPIPDRPQRVPTEVEANEIRALIGGVSANETDDDRRTCSQCLNLMGRVCTIARPGGLVSANPGYRPATPILQRCAGYLPNSTDHDQRRGNERWPGL
nr:hypothetical protein [Dechloromonas sp.]